MGKEKKCIKPRIVGLCFYFFFIYYFYFNHFPRSTWTLRLEINLLAMKGKRIRCK